MAESPVLSYKRILLKLSGEALLGDNPYGISPSVMDEIASEIADVNKMGVQVGLVIGGGNIFRGVAGSAQGMDRACADQMGMLATVINALALQDALKRQSVPVRVQSAIEMNKVTEPFIRGRAIKHLEKGRVVIFAAGTGNPFFTTDTAAALRALEIGAEVLFKATKVDGIYSADPVKDPNAHKFEQLTYKEVLKKELGFMDAAAISLAMDAGLPVIVFNMLISGNIKRAVLGESVGSLVKGGKEL